MIVVVELPLMSTDPKPKALVYDRYRELEVLIPITEDLTAMMRGRERAFFHAHLEQGVLVLDRLADKQRW